MTCVREKTCPLAKIIGWLTRSGNRPASIFLSPHAPLPGPIHARPSSPPGATAGRRFTPPRRAGRGELAQQCSPLRTPCGQYSEYLHQLQRWIVVPIRHNLQTIPPQNFPIPPNSGTSGDLGTCASIALRSAVAYASSVTLFRDKQKMIRKDTSLVRVARTCCGAWLVFSRGRRANFRNSYVTRALDALGPFFPSRPSRSLCPSSKCPASMGGVLLSSCFGRRASARAVCPPAKGSCFQESRNARR